MKHIKLSITDDQRANLKKLADYLLFGELKAEFTMKQYSDGLYEREEINCGTVGCAVGHGPYAGIPKNIGESYMGYSIRVFDNDQNELWSFLFSSVWTETDNTPGGAGRRILYALSKGIPVDSDGEIDYSIKY